MSGSTAIGIPVPESFCRAHYGVAKTLRLAEGVRQCTAGTSKSGSMLLCDDGVNTVFGAQVSAAPDIATACVV